MIASHIFLVLDAFDSFKNNFIYLFLSLAVLGLGGCAGFSLVVAGGILSGCGAQASHCGFSGEVRALKLRGLQQLRLPGSRAQAWSLWATGLAVPQQVGSAYTRNRTPVSCIGRQILYH